MQERTAALTRAHRGVRENEERLRMALEVAQIAAWEWHLASGPDALVDRSRGAVRVSDGLVRPGAAHLRAVHPDDRRGSRQAIAAALETGIVRGANTAPSRPDGSVVWITERGRVFADAGRRSDGRHQPRRHRGARAAQERERLLQREREARDEAERQSRLKDEFLATLSHELRTPMNAILGWLAILESGKPIRDIHSALAVIARNAQMQAKLIDDLLDMNRLMSGNVRARASRRSTSARCCRRTMQSAAAGGRRQGRAADRVGRSDAGRDRSADARRLQQVLWNLLHNAIKFTPTRRPRRDSRAARRRRRCRSIGRRTTARASRRRSCRMSSSASASRTPRRRASASGSVSACRSPSTWSSCTAARSRRIAPGPGQGATFVVQNSRRVAWSDGCVERRVAASQRPPRLIPVLLIVFERLLQHGCNRLEVRFFRQHFRIGFRRRDVDVQPLADLIQQPEDGGG